MRSRLIRSASLALIAAIAASCADSSSAPQRRLASIALTPRFSAADAAIFRSLGAFDLTVDNVEVVIARSGSEGGPEGELLADTVVAFPITASQISIEVSVQLQAKEELLEAVVILRAGNIDMFSGSQSIAAKVGETATSDGPISVTYVGPGFQTTQLAVTAPTTGTHVGGKVPFLALAKDGQGLPVPDVPVSWRSTNTAAATVDANGLVTGVAVGTTQIIGRTPNDVADTVSFRITAPPTRLALTSGDGQRGTVGTLLQANFTVQALDAAGAGVPGAAIAFAAGAGGGSVDQTSMLTDDKGIASVKLTLGTVAGDNAYTATFGTLPPITIHATALAGIPVIVGVVSGDKQTGTAGIRLPTPLVVIVTDNYANPVSGAPVTWRAPLNDGIVVGSTTTAADGRTSLDYVLPRIILSGSDIVTATLAQSPGTTATFSLTSTAGAPAGLAALPGSQFQTVDFCAGSVLPQPLAVQTVDQFGNTAPFKGLSVTFSIDSGFATFGDSQARESIVLTNDLGVATAARYTASSSLTQTVTASALYPPQTFAAAQFFIDVSFSSCANRQPSRAPKLPSPSEDVALAAPRYVIPNEATDPP